MLSTGRDVIEPFRSFCLYCSTGTTQRGHRWDIRCPEDRPGPNQCIWSCKRTLV